MRQRRSRYEAPLAAWAGGGGGGGGGGSLAWPMPSRFPTLGLPVSLRDDYAQPEQVAALLLTREGVMNPSALEGRMPPRATQAQRVWRAEPWVRQTLAVQELMDGLRFSLQLEHDDIASEVGLGFRQLPRSVAGSGDDGSGESALAFVRLQRPPPRLLVEEVAQVLAYADLRAERSAEILSQIDGQWAHWASILPLRADRTPHTLALLTVALQWAIAVELRFKHWLGCPRPMVLSPQVQPCVTTPGHGSYPMGHAVQAFLVASLLQTMCGVREHGPWGAQLNRTAFRIATNRVVAGLHFPVDLVAGLLLGKALARYAQSMAQPEMTVRPWRPVVFDPRRYRALGPLGGLHDSQQVWRFFEHTDLEVDIPVAEPSRSAPVWAELWRAALREWQEEEVRDV